MPKDDNSARVKFADVLSDDSSSPPSMCDMMQAPECFVEDAKNIVASVIQSSLQHLDEEQLLREQTMQDMVQEMSVDSDTSSAEYLPNTQSSQCENKTANIDWMKIEEFTIDKAYECLYKYIKEAWRVHAAWLYSVKHESSVFADPLYAVHVFKVVYSLPTRRSPIPGTTAHVYFTFKCSKIKPKSYPVEVYYQLESQRSHHVPGSVTFRDKWLTDIIDNKILAIQQLTF